MRHLMFAIAIVCAGGTSFVFARERGSLFTTAGFAGMVRAGPPPWGSRPIRNAQPDVVSKSFPACLAHRGMSRSQRLT
jgi:hypothetical protein